MTIWRIKDGVPSLADAFLVVGGLIGTCVAFIPCVEPLLDFFEPHGLAYLGYFVALMIMLGLGAFGVWVFLRNEKKMRWEVIVPRRVFAVTATPLIFIAMYFTSPWVRRSEIGFFEHIALLVLLFIPLFGLLMRASLRYPQRTAEVALWFNVSLVGLGTVAKFVSLFLKK